MILNFWQWNISFLIFERMLIDQHHITWYCKSLMDTSTAKQKWSLSYGYHCSTFLQEAISAYQHVSNVYKNGISFRLSKTWWWQCTHTLLPWPQKFGQTQQLLMAKDYVSSQKLVYIVTLYFTSDWVPITTITIRRLAHSLQLLPKNGMQVWSC